MPLNIQFINLLINTLFLKKSLCNWLYELLTFVKKKKNHNVVELVGGGSVIIGPTPSSCRPAPFKYVKYVNMLNIYCEGM